MLVACCDQNLGISTSRCSNTTLPFSLPMTAALVSHSTASNGSIPSRVNVLGNSRPGTVTTSAAPVDGPRTLSTDRADCIPFLLVPARTLPRVGARQSLCVHPPHRATEVCSQRCACDAIPPRAGAVPRSARLGATIDRCGRRDPSCGRPSLVVTQGPSLREAGRSRVGRTSALRRATMLPSQGVVNGNLHHILCVPLHPIPNIQASDQILRKAFQQRHLQPRAHQSEGWQTICAWANFDTPHQTAGQARRLQPGPGMTVARLRSAFHLRQGYGGQSRRSKPCYLLSPLARVSALSANEAAST